LDNSDKIILSLCSGSGSWEKPYVEAGYDVRSITLPDNDVRLYTPPANVYGILAAPPCTEFSTAKDWAIPRDIAGGLEIVNACLNIIESCKPKFWALENPAGLLKNYIGKPTYAFQPWWYGDAWTKKTMLWGEFNIPDRLFMEQSELQWIEGLYICRQGKLPELTNNINRQLKKFHS